MSTLWTYEELDPTEQAIINEYDLMFGGYREMDPDIAVELAAMTVEELEELDTDEFSAGEIDAAINVIGG